MEQNEKNLSSSKYATHKLLHFLLTLFEQPETFESLFHLTQTRIDNWLDELAPLCEEIDLSADNETLTVEQALILSSVQTPFVTLLENGSWMVFYGFAAGRVRTAHIYDDLLEEQRLSQNEVLTMMGVKRGQPCDFLVIQAKKPLDHAVSDAKHEHLSPITRLMALLRAERSDIWLILGLSAGSGFLALSAPVAVQAVVNTVSMGGMGQPLTVLCAILFFLLVFSGVLHVLKSYLTELVERRLFVRLAIDLAYRLPKIKRDVFDHHRGAELLNRFFDIQTVQKACASILLEGITLVMQGLVGLILLAFYHPFLLGFDIVLLLCIIFIMVLLGRGAVQTSIKESVAKYALVDWLETIADGPLAFKFTSAEQLAQERTDILAHDYLNNKKSHYKILLRQIISSSALYAIASTALLLIGGYLVIEGQLTLGQLVAAELIVSTVLASLIKFGKHVEGFYDLMASVDKIGHLLDLPLEREHGQIVPDLGNATTVQVRDLTYAYTGSARTLFTNLNIQITAGERVAIFAKASGGKSTLAEILYGLRQGQKGDVEIGGYNLDRINLPIFREQIQLIHGIDFIDGTLMDNVLLGREEIESAQVDKVLNDLGLLEELRSQFEKARSLHIYSSGSPLSQTQQRLLLFARAMVNLPALIIVDGMLDELDEESLERVLTPLLSPQAQWTLVILTKSKSLAARCDRTIMLS